MLDMRAFRSSRTRDVPEKNTHTHAHSNTGARQLGARAPIVCVTRDCVRAFTRICIRA